MMPSIIYETLVADSILEGLLGGNNIGRILELQSIDERPFSDEYFIIIDFQGDDPAPFRGVIGKTYMQVWVHHPKDVDRDYSTITRILNRIQVLLSELVDINGDDEIKLTQIDPYGRSGNFVDPAWETITRNQIYGVLFDQLHA